MAKVLYSNYYHIVFCLKLEVTPVTSSLPPVVSFSYVQELILVNREYITLPCLRTFFSQ